MIRNIGDRCVRAASVIVGLCLFSGCSSDYTIDGAGFTPASHPEMMQVTDNAGPFIANPVIVPVTFRGDPKANAFDEFVDEIGKSQYWSAIGAEYGVGAAVAGDPVQLPKAPPTVVQSDVDALVAGRALGTPTSSTIYVFFYPAGTKVTTNDGKVGCVDFDEFHDKAAVPHVGYVQYALIPHCTGSADPFSAATVAASRALIGAATDPRKNAFTGTDTASMGFAVATGQLGEVGDMCNMSTIAPVKPDDMSVLVQRSWSNRAAAAGLDPCVPAPAAPYFNAMPVLPDTVSVTSSRAGVFSTRGVSLANGKSTTVELVLFSSAQTGGWQLSVRESEFSAGALSLSLDATSGKNGDIVHLTITAKKMPAGGAGFVVESTLDGRTFTSGGMVAPR